MSIQVKGDKELKELFKGLPLLLQDKLLQQAHTRAVKPLVEKAKLLAPEGATGHLVDSIGVVKTSKATIMQRELGTIHVGPRRSPRYKGWHGHLVEYGTRKRYSRGKTGRFSMPANRGIMKKTPFMNPAWEQTSSQVTKSIEGELSKVITRYLQKQAKKNP